MDNTGLCKSLRACKMCPECNFLQDSANALAQIGLICHNKRTMPVWAEERELFTMKTFTRLMALLMALLMLFACAVAEDTSTLDPVLAVVGDDEITLSEADEMAYMLYYYGYVEAYPDYDAAVAYMVQTAVIENHIKTAGYMDFTEEEMAAFRNEADAEWEAMLDEYIANYLTEDTEEARASLREQAEAYYAAYGYSQSTTLEDLLISEGYTRLEAALADGYVPTEEEIQDVFMQYGVQYQQMFENDVASYEYYTNYYGYESWYTPAGYRSVLHILLDVDEALLTAWQDAQMAQDEAASAETVDEAAVAAAKETVEAARQAILDSKKAELDDIYARLEQGEDIKNLIAQYNTDPGMQDAATLAEGYHVHPESIVYDVDFTAGCFEEQMTAPGTYSNPVVSQFGIHVIYYLKDVMGGLIMTDAVRAEIEEFLVSNQMQLAYDAGIAEWEKELTVTVNDELIAAAQQEAEAAMAEQSAE